MWENLRAVTVDKRCEPNVQIAAHARTKAGNMELPMVETRNNEHEKQAKRRQKIKKREKEGKNKKRREKY